MSSSLGACAFEFDQAYRDRRAGWSRAGRGSSICALQMAALGRSPRAPAHAMVDPDATQRICEQRKIPHACRVLPHFLLTSQTKDVLLSLSTGSGQGIMRASKKGQACSQLTGTTRETTCNTRRRGSTKEIDPRSQRHEDSSWDTA
jgi:hypothetical protein